MKRTISFIVVLAMIFSLMMTVLPASAAEYYAINTSTEDPAVTYGQTPSVKLWPNGVYAQSFEAHADIVGISFGCWNDGTTNDVEVSFYQYNTDITTSIAGTAVLTTTVSATQGQDATNLISLPSTLPAGKYVIKLAVGADYLILAQAPKAPGAEIYTNEVTGLESGNAVIMAVYSEKPEGISDASEIKPDVENKLTMPIKGTLSVTSGTYIIDLNGQTWTDTQEFINVSGSANVTIKDSVGGGRIVSTSGDTILMGGGTLTLDNVTVKAPQGSADALFINDGSITIKNSTLYAGKAALDLSQRGTGADVVVENVTFAGYPDDPNNRTSAIEFRHNNKTVTLKGDNKFNNNTIIIRNDCTKPVAELIKCDDENASFALVDDTRTYSDGSNTWSYKTISYTYTAPVVKVPAFTTYTISLSTGISIEYLVENATENTKVQVNGVDLESDSYTYDEVEYTRFTFSDFGPQQMGDVFEATLIVDGVEKDTLEASVKAYCDEIIASEDATSKLSLLAKDILAYGAAAQNYKNYNKDALVNADVEASGNTYNTPKDKSIVLYTMSNPSVTWKYATVEFANTIKLVLAFEGEADMVKAVISDVEYEFETIETDDNGYSYVIVDSFTPDQFNEEIDATAYLDGTAVSKTIRYSVGSYANKKGNADNALADLVQAMTIYGESVAAYLVG